MEEKRKYPRCRVGLRIAIFTENDGRRESLERMTLDVGIGGVSVMGDRKISPNQLATIYLLTPSDDQDSPQKIVSAQGEILENIYSGRQVVRTNLRFTKFLGYGEEILLRYMLRIAGAEMSQ